MRTISSLLLGAALSLAFVSGVSAQSLNVNDVGLSNVAIGAGTSGAGGNRGNAALDNSFSLGGGRISAQTTSTTTFGNGVNQNPAGNNGIGGVSTGFAQTTRLEGGGNAIANTQLVGSGGVNGGLNPVNGGISTTNISATNGGFDRTANSYAGAGLNGYSGSQMVGGPGTVTNTTNGAAFGAGAAVSGGAGIQASQNTGYTYYPTYAPVNTIAAGSTGKPY